MYLINFLLIKRFYSIRLFSGLIVCLKVVISYLYMINSEKDYLIMMKIITLIMFVFLKLRLREIVASCDHCHARFCDGE